MNDNTETNRLRCRWSGNLIAEVRTTEAPRYGYNVNGYGRKVPTRYLVKLPGCWRWRRVYVTIWSNTGTAYIILKGKKHVVNIETDPEVFDLDRRCIYNLKGRYATVRQNPWK